MTELFLIAALAFPPMGATGYQIKPFSMSMTLEQEEQMLRWFIWKRAPGAEIVLLDDGVEPQGAGWERVPIRYRNKNVWIKRKPISVQMGAVLWAA